MGSKITADGDGSHEIIRHLLFERKVMTNLDSILMEKEMATHSSILAWKNPWTEESGGLSPWDYMTEHVCTRVEGDGLVAINW